MIGSHAQQPGAFVLGALKSDIVVCGKFEERLLKGVLCIGTASQAHETDPPHGIAMLCHGTLYARVVSHAIDVSLCRGATCARHTNHDARPGQRRCRRCSQRRCRPQPRARDSRRLLVRSFGHCRTRRLRLHPQTRRGAGRPSHRQPAWLVRNGSAAHCMYLPAMRHARQPAGNLPGRYPRDTPAHTGNRPMRPSQHKPQRTLPDRQVRRRVRPWP